LTHYAPQFLFATETHRPKPRANVTPIPCRNTPSGPTTTPLSPPPANYLPIATSPSPSRLTQCPSIPVIPIDQSTFG
jgi:hypothetical protein